MNQPGNLVGALIKSYSYKGELVLKGKPQIIKKLTNGIPLFIAMNEQRIPFFITDISIDQSGEKCILKLEFIDSDKEARRFVGCDVYLHSENQDETNSSVPHNDFIGFKVVNSSGNKEYKIVDFYDYADNPILVLDEEGSEFLLPKNADYILSIDTDEKIIVVDFPDGFF